MAATQNRFLWCGSGLTEIHQSAITLPFKNPMDFNLPRYCMSWAELASALSSHFETVYFFFSPSVNHRLAGLAAVSGLHFGHVPRHWGPVPRLPVSVSCECQQSLGDQLAQWPLWICEAPGVRWVGHGKGTGEHRCPLMQSVWWDRFVLWWLLIKTLILELAGI